MYRYERMWTQIADAFKDYDDHLIFESLNEEGGWDSMNTDKSYELLNEINQKFVDIVRNSGGNNAERHLLIAGYQTNIDKTCDSRFKMPDDPENRCAVSVHYYDPAQFAILSEDASWGKAKTEWGTQDEIDYLNEKMDLLKTTFVDNGIPVIIGEYGVTLENKTQDQVVNFLSKVAEAAYTRGMCPMLWDTYYGDGTYTNYDRLNGTLKNPDLKAAYQAVLKEDVKQPCTITADSDEITVSYADGSFKFSASSDSDGKMSYSSSNEDIFTIDQDGNVTIKKAGTANIVVHVDSTDTYLPATPLNVQVTVSKIENPPTTPDTEMTVDYSVENTRDIELPDGWSWSKQYDLIPGETVEATAIYDDTNYKNRKVKVLITRKTEETSSDNSSDTSSADTSSSDNSSTASSSSSASGSTASTASASTSSAAKSADASPATGVGGGLAGITLAFAAAAFVTNRKKK
jgi:hypothetical protein